MSTGKDKRTIIWDLVSCKPVYDLPNDTSASPGGAGSTIATQDAGDFFGGGNLLLGETTTKGIRQHGHRPYLL